MHRHDPRYTCCYMGATAAEPVQEPRSRNGMHVQMALQQPWEQSLMHTLE